MRYRKNPFTCLTPWLQTSYISKNNNTKDFQKPHHMQQMSHPPATINTDFLRIITAKIIIIYGYCNILLLEITIFHISGMTVHSQ